MNTKPETILQTEPLSDVEKEGLQFIIDTRRKLLFRVYPVLMLIAGVTSLRALGQQRPHTNAARYFDYSIFGHNITKFEMFIIVFILFESIIVASGIIIYNNSIHCLVKDIRSGVKELVPYEILKKEYFAVNGRYYFRIDNPDHMHHEVDADTFNTYSEGDTVYLYRTIYTHYFFDASGSFTIL